ncbi:MAG: PPOX class F420-dependent oxidoreductase [Acidimicrobiia bacterium]
MPSYDSIPSSHRDLVDGRHLAVLTTVDAQGDPQSTAVWYLYDGDVIRISTRTVLQKYRNVERHPRVTLFIADPTTHFRALEIRATVAVVDDPDGDFFETIAVAYGQDLATFPGLRDRRVVLELTPTHATTVGLGRQHLAGLKPPS